MTPYRVNFSAMASVHSVEIAGMDAVAAERAATAAIADVRRIEQKYTRYSEDSLTSRINRAAGRDAVAIDAETAALLHYADICHRQSQGRFDLTSGVLRRLWNFRAEVPAVPSAAEIERVRRLIAWPKVDWDEHSIRLPHPGMEIDFGGIGKEYAADRVATILQEHGARHALVNLGGDVRAIGTRADGAPWRVGIRHPRKDNATIAGLELADGALATSGDYERYFEIDGRRYCHIIDAASGLPVTWWQSVSVKAPLCTVAGSCATIAMLLEADAPAFLEAQGVSWFGVRADGSVHTHP